MKYTFLILSVFICCQCNLNNKQIDKIKNDKIISLNIDNVKTKFLNNASLLVDSVQYIQLESNIDAIIGDISKIKWIDDKLYIHDKISNALYIFSDKGEYLFCLDNRGKGPGQFINIGTFSVDKKDKSIHLYDDHSFKITKYDSIGNLVSEKMVEYLIEDFIVTQEVYNISTSLPCRNKIKNGSSMNRLLSIQENKINRTALKSTYTSALRKFQESSNRFSCNNNSISLLDEYSSSILKIDTSGYIINKNFIDFGKYTVKNIYDMTEKEMEIYLKSDDNNNSAKLYRINETSSWWLMEYSYQTIMHLSLYSKTAQKSINLRGYWLNDKDNFPLPFPITVQGDYLISKMDAFTFKTLMEDTEIDRPQHLKDLNEKLNSTDNPILFKIKLKDSIDF